jgi:hypothetical protein
MPALTALESRRGRALFGRLPPRLGPRFLSCISHVLTERNRRRREGEEKVKRGGAINGGEGVDRNQSIIVLLAGILLVFLFGQAALGSLQSIFWVGFALGIIALIVSAIEQFVLYLRRQNTAD